jgi:membrane protease YdiL (CAAX protease family)
VTEKPEDNPQPQISVGMAAGFYGFLVIVGWGILQVAGDMSLFVWHDRNGVAPWMEAALGVGVGLGFVFASQVLDRYSEWAQELGREFGKIFGELRVEQVLILAVASGIGEEAFFRGCLQQLLTEVAFSGAWAPWIALTITSLGFGLLHIGPDLRKFFPWTIMAIVFGFVFGGMYLYTGDLLAPIVAHFTINFFNIMAISQKYGRPDGESKP